MQSRSTIHLAVILAALLFLSASGLCAAFLPPISPSAHPCCPNHNSHSGPSVPRCCVITGGREVPATVSGPGMAMGITSTPTQAVEAQLRFTEDARVERPFFHAAQLYVQFHQLLI